MTRSRLIPRPELEGLGGWIPALAVRALLAIVGALLAAVDYGFGGWLVVGVIWSVLAACAPQYLLGWALILFLAAGRLAHHAHLTAAFLILLAGLHLLHLLSTLALELPWRSWVSPAVFVRPLLRFAAIQVPAQLLAVVCLVLLAPSRSGHRPLSAAAVAVVGAVALAALALLLLAPRADREASP